MPESTATNAASYTTPRDTIAEIAFRAWTSDLKLRHTSYKGLREMQDNAAVFKIPPA